MPPKGFRVQHTYTAIQLLHFTQFTSDGCSVYTRSLNGSGYGPHRRLWTLLNGPIPAGMDVDHICYNRACVEPSHLQLVPHVENMRMAARRKLPKPVCKNGHPAETNAVRHSKGNGEYRWRCKSCVTAWDKKWKANRETKSCSS